MPDPLSTINTRRTPQSEKADDRQVKNAAGGYTFEIDKWAQLRRFLVLGVDGGTFYTSAPELAKENAGVVIALAKEDGARVVAELEVISLAGRAPKQNATLFALAAVSAFGDEDAKNAAHNAIPEICRTGTMLFQFVAYAEQMRGWGRGLRRGVGRWYENMHSDDLAYQAAKFKQRDGWSHYDLLRLSHPNALTDEKKVIYDWICKRGEGTAFLNAIDSLHKDDVTASEVIAVIKNHPVSWEMIPTEFLATLGTWTALLDYGRVPLGAVIRQLPRLTNLGLFQPGSPYIYAVANRITNGAEIRKSRLHPINLLVAQKTYASGRSARGEGEWTPVPQIIDALDAAFYASFGNVEPSGKRTMVALDVSGSMGMHSIAGLPLTPREASAAMALITMATEPQHFVVGFTGGGRGTYSSRFGYDGSQSVTPLPLSPRQRLDDVVKAVSHLPFGRTDCAAPMVYALKNKLEVDTFIIYTDNETWAGDDVHPHQALREYREKMGIDAKLVVVAMTPSNNSIADPSDAGQLDIAGFDAAVPKLISGFSAGLV